MYLAHEHSMQCLKNGSINRDDVINPSMLQGRVSVR